MASLKEKLGEFAKTVFGGDAAKAEQFAAKIETAQKEIEGAGVAFKEAAADSATTTEKAKIEIEADPEEEVMDPKTGKPMDMSGMTEEEKAACRKKSKEITTKRGGTSGPDERAGMFAAMHDEGTYDEGKLGGGKSDSGPYKTRRPKTPYSRRKKEAGDESTDAGEGGEDVLTVGDLTPEEFVAVMDDWLQPITKELSAQKTATKEKQDAQDTALKAAQDEIVALKGRIAELEGTRSRDVFFRASREGAAPAATLTPPGESKQEKATKETNDFISWAVGGTRK